MSIRLYLCDPDKRSTCKPKDEILEWLQDKYIVTLSNRRIFNADKYDDLKLMDDSVFNFYKIDPQQAQMMVNEIQMQFIDFQDDYFQFGNLTLSTADTFRIHQI